MKLAVNDIFSFAGIAGFRRNIITNLRNPALVSLITFALAVLTAVQAESSLAPAVERTLEPGKPVNRADYRERRFLALRGEIVLRGETVALSWRTIDPGIETGAETFTGDRVTWVMRGSLQKQSGGAFAPMRERDLVYEEAGTVTALMAGDNTAEVVTFHWTGAGDSVSRPMIQPGRVMNEAYLQWCFPDDGRRMAKIVQGRRGQVCFVRIDPGTAVADETMSGETMLFVLRGGMDVSIDGVAHSLKQDDIILVSGDSRVSFTPGPEGCRYAEVTAPARKSYTDALSRRVATFHGIFPPFVQPEPVADGRFGEPPLSFIEGPVWYNGRLYFTDMSAGGLYRLEPGGTVTTLNDGILPCGMTAMTGGNFAVCDIRNNIVVEMTPEGKQTAVLADTFEDASLPGTPNDIICDSKGGLYITVMSFAGSPGSNVLIYRSPEGSLRRVTEPGDFGIPNGIALSPDGGTLYVNDDRNEHVMACDVRRDGSLGKPRPFARLIIDESVLGGERAKTFADGMTVDAGGNLYVCASGFLQVFDSEGNYRGGFVLPKPAFHVTFGGANLSTLYIACLNRIFTIETNMKGLVP